MPVESHSLTFEFAELCSWHSEHAPSTPLLMADTRCIEVSHGMTAVLGSHCNQAVQQHSHGFFACVCVEDDEEIAGQEKCVESA